MGARLPTLDALMIMETILVATLRAHFRFKGRAADQTPSHAR
jgi:hypothetical protein